MGLILLLPVFFIVSIINIVSGSQVLFIQKRVGMELKPFPLIKFATMVNNAHIIGGTVTYKDDPRITKIGAFLRKYKINELPQLINVLKGDMSLVGPRPLPQSEIRIYPPETARIIYSVKPGITGLASLYFYNEEVLLPRDKKLAEEFFKSRIIPLKSELEVWYAQNRTMLLDIKLIIATLAVIFVPSYMIFSFVSNKLGKPGIRRKTQEILKIHRYSSIQN
jgi:lipopolysaccharide/colanic/teichoic acid biosynthesis glycosyltransferase